MAVRDSELQCLQPGDQIVIISKSEVAMLGGDDWVGWVSDMSNYCTQTLTVSSVVDVFSTAAGHIETRIYVKENDWWWKAAFIDCIVYNSSEMDAPDEDSLMNLLFS